MEHDDPVRVSVARRFLVAANLIVGLRAHDLRAAVTFLATMYPGCSLPLRLGKFAGWVLRQSLVAIPEALSTARFARTVSRTPIWLAEGNPLANYPWVMKRHAVIPPQVDVVVIGAGFSGAACAYHWSKAEAGSMVVLEMGEPASGASGRNEGLVVMGRHYAMVQATVQCYLDRVRADLDTDERQRLAGQFAAVYARSAYKNADLIEQTVRQEGYQCDYARNGWIQARDEGSQEALHESIRVGRHAGFMDWRAMGTKEVQKTSGMQVDQPAGYSRGAASFHPARWVWSLLGTALASDAVELYTRTRVEQVEDTDGHYNVRTERGLIRARFVVNATESYTGMLHRRYGELIHPVQTQAASGTGGPVSMREHIGLSGERGFFGRHGKTIMVGSDATRLPTDGAGRNNPSRFITKFLLGELHRYFDRTPVEITHEWSGTPGFTVDEYPVVGLLDGKRQYIIGGMCGSGTAVSFNGSRHIVQQILGREGPDDYPAQYFGVSRILDPANHDWPQLENLS